MKKFSVTLEFRPITVEVESSTGDHNALLELAKQEVLKQLSVKFPSLSYSITEGEAILNPRQGMFVKVKSEKRDENGIITKINPKSINVSLSGGRNIQCSKGLLSRANNAKFEDIFMPRHELLRNAWYEGNTGYMVNKKEIIPVICCSAGKTNYKFFIVNNKGGEYYTLSQSQTKVIFDSLEDAQKMVKSKVTA
jgi:hypothetical protein